MPVAVFLVLAGITAWMALGHHLNPRYEWIWFGGMTLAVLVAGLVSQPLRWQTREDEQRRRHLWALEKLTEVAASISARIDAPQAALDQLTAAAHELLEMDRAGIALFDAEARTLKIVAASAGVNREAPSVYSIDDLPLSRRVLENREAMFVGDSLKYEAPLNTEALRQHRAGSAALLPLHAGGRLLGLLFATSTKPQEFSDSQKRLAKLLAGQAAVILSNSDLYQRMAEAMRHRQELFEHREAIFAVNAAVYQASSFEESLHIIVALAPGVLEVDLCMITLDDGTNSDRSVVAAITPPIGADLIGKSYFRHGTNSEIVRATRRMLVVDDAKNHPGTHPGFRDRLDVGSVAYLPLLRTDGEVMGMLTLIRHAVGAFKQEQLNLAEMFTARAAAAIETARLLDQTRRDAEAKATLLRELNHRVKNNLSSIISLLSLDEPELSPAARQWLNRAIDRIRTMARTHDLFASGLDRVSIGELVDQMIPSLSVALPPGVRIEKELAAAEVLLRTDQAVSLAMVLHELCYNAICHGTGSTGVVTIRAAMAAGQRYARSDAQTMVLEVIDGGRPTEEPQARRSLALLGASIRDSDRAAEDADRAAAGSPAARIARVGSGGLGLMLVEGLVTRELGGTFCLTRTEGGGSIARVQFPTGAAETVVDCSDEKSKRNSECPHPPY